MSTQYNINESLQNSLNEVERAKNLLIKLFSDPEQRMKIEDIDRIKEKSKKIIEYAKVAIEYAEKFKPLTVEAQKDAV